MAYALRRRRATSNTCRAWSVPTDSHGDSTVIGRVSCYWTRDGNFFAAGADYSVVGRRIGVFPLYYCFSNNTPGCFVGSHPCYSFRQPLATIHKHKVGSLGRIRTYIMSVNSRLSYQLHHQGISFTRSVGLAAPPGFAPGFAGSKPVLLLLKDGAS